MVYLKIPPSRKGEGDFLYLKKAKTEYEKDK